MIEFSNPYGFFALILPILFRSLLKSVNKDEGHALKTPFYDKIKKLNYRSLKFVGKISYEALILYVTWFLLVIAISRPVLVSKPVMLKPKGRVVMFAIDASNSMSHQDFKIKSISVTRLEAVKWVLQRFVKDRKGDALGLVAFGDKPFLVTPPTFDIYSFSQMLNDVEIGMAGEKTSIGDAIALSIKNLKKFDNKNKILVLLSDGVNRVGNISIADAVTIAKIEKIKIYTIAIGQKTKIDNDYNEDTLRKIAKFTNGKFYRANHIKELERGYKKIGELEPIKVKDIFLKPKKEIFYMPLILALIVIFAAVFYKYKGGKYDK